MERCVYGGMFFNYFSQCGYLYFTLNYVTLVNVITLITLRPTNDVTYMILV